MKKYMPFIALLTALAALSPTNLQAAERHSGSHSSQRQGGGQRGHSGSSSGHGGSHSSAPDRGRGGHRAYAPSHGQGGYRFHAPQYGQEVHHVYAPRYRSERHYDRPAYPHGGGHVVVPGIHLDFGSRH